MTAGCACDHGENGNTKGRERKKFHRVDGRMAALPDVLRCQEDADGSKVSAEYKDGVLKVHLPKSEKAKPKAIEVKVA